MPHLIEVQAIVGRKDTPVETNGGALERHEQWGLLMAGEYHWRSSDGYEQLTRTRTRFVGTE